MMIVLEYWMIDLALMGGHNEGKFCLYNLLKDLVYDMQFWLMYNLMNWTLSHKEIFFGPGLVSSWKQFLYDYIAFILWCLETYPINCFWCELKKHSTVLTSFFWGRGGIFSSLLMSWGADSVKHIPSTALGVRWKHKVQYLLPSSPEEVVSSRACWSAEGLIQWNISL